MFRKLLFRVVLPTSVLVGGACVMYKQRLASNSAITPKEFNDKQAAAIAVALASPEVLRATSLTLFRYSTCPFCNKVQTFLRSQNLKFDVVEVDPLFKHEIRASGYGKVPQLKLGTDGPLIVDSDYINNYLAPVLLPKEAIDGNNIPEVRDWANNVLARYLVINTNRTWAESFEGYDYVDDIQDFGTLRKLAVKAVGGLSMHLVSEFVTKRKLAKFGYTKGQNEREALFKEMEQWAEKLDKNTNFHGGKNPDLADIEVYGILQSVRTFSVYKEIETRPSIEQWMKQMDEQVKQ